jgi:hypothetical protein
MRGAIAFARLSMNEDWSLNMDGQPELTRTEIESSALPVSRNADNAGTDKQPVNLRSRPRGPLLRPLLRFELSLRLQSEEEQLGTLKFS